MGKSLYEQLMVSVEKYPHYPAMRFENHEWDYLSLKKSIDATAKKLVALGVAQREVVAVSLPNCPEAVNLFYALSRIGAISYNIHPLTPPAMMASLVKRSGSRFLICLSLSAASFRPVLGPSVRILAINPYHHVNLLKAIAVSRMSKKAAGVESYSSLKSAASLPEVSVDASEDAVYLNTGGTNGEPKIVRLSSTAINALALKGYDLIGGDVRRIKMLTAIPLFHGFGLAMGVHTPLVHGAETVLMLKFNTKEAIAHIQKGRATVIIGVPALYNALLSRDSFYGPWLQNQIIAFIGGDSVPQSLLDRWNEAMEKYGSDARLYEGYGLTETVTVSNVNFKNNSRRGTIGKALPGIHEIVVDTETKKPLPPDSLGEIYISGDTLMNGYLHDEKNSADVFQTLDGVKYIATKDYGSIDKDGYLTFKQRLKRVVKINGETLCPSDVEQVALDDPRVYEAYCYGVPDERKGHIFRLLIVIRKGDHPGNPEQVKRDIYSALEERLTANYKPDKIVDLEKLPRTPVGKIDTAAIEKMEKEGTI